MVKGLVGVRSGSRVVFSHDDGGLRSGSKVVFSQGVLVRPSPFAFLAFTDGFCITAPAKMYTALAYFPYILPNWWALGRFRISWKLAVY